MCSLRRVNEVAFLSAYSISKTTQQISVKLGAKGLGKTWDEYNFVRAGPIGGLTRRKFKFSLIEFLKNYSSHV